MNSIDSFAFVICAIWFCQCAYLHFLIKKLFYLHLATFTVALWVFFLHDYSGSLLLVLGNVYSVIFMLPFRHYDEISTKITNSINTFLPLDAFNFHLGLYHFLWAQLAHIYILIHIQNNAKKYKTKMLICTCKTYINEWRRRNATIENTIDVDNIIWY